MRAPNGSTSTLRSPLGGSPDFGGDDIRFPPGASESQKKEQFDSLRRKASAASRLVVTLAPGESLRTRGDGAGDGFRMLLTREKIGAPGAYELHAELDGLSKPGVPSNTVRFTLVP
jgi:hypothetical protein